MSVSGLAARVAALARREPGAPLVTFYDDDTGERTELSRATAQNWVAKTGGFLVDELELERGDRLLLALHPHWQVTVTALACWSVGVSVVPADPEGGAAAVADRVTGTGAAAALAREDLLTGLAAARPRLPGLRELVGVSQRPLAARLREVPAGVLDLAAEVPPQPDDFAPIDPPGPGDEALVAGGDVLDAAALTARAEAAGAALGLTADDRLLLTPEPDAVGGAVLGVVAPALAGAGVVLCRRWPAAGLLSRVEQERVSLVVVDEPQAAAALAGLPESGPRVTGSGGTGSGGTGPAGLRGVVAAEGGPAAQVLADRLGVPLLRP